MKIRPITPQSDHLAQEYSEKASLVIGLAIGTLILILFGAAITHLISKRKRNYVQRTIILAKSPIEGPFILKKSTAIKSPGSLNGPTLKKLPSPNGSKSSLEKESPEKSEKNIITEECNKENNAKINGNNVIDVEQKGTIEKTNSKEEKIVFKKDNKETSLGQLQFKCLYNKAQESLCIVIIKCTQLPSKTSDSLDPYVKLQLLPNQHKVKTRVIRKTCNPIYEEEFVFYGINVNVLTQSVLHFVILNFDRYSRDHVIGHIYYKLDNIPLDALEKPLFVAKDIEAISSKILKEGKGEILISLCHQPAANRLTVVVLKARNLPKMDLNGLCDPYVKIYLMSGKKRIGKKKTHVKKHTLSPVFNESFVFDVPHNQPISKISLEILVLDYDRVTKNELIGKLTIGSSSGGTPFKHWKQVETSPRRQIAEWHQLE